MIWRGPFRCQPQHHTLLPREPDDAGVGERLAYRRIANCARREGRPYPIRFLWHRVVYEGPRRYRARGYARTMLDWLLNSVAVSFLGRSFSRTWDAVR